MRRHASLIIGGQYLDSFIYSGTLFLLDLNGVLSSFDWGSLVGDVLLKHRRMDLVNVFTDSRLDSRALSDDGNLDLEVDDEILSKNLTGRIDRSVWPTDINVYANRVYISDESGVYSLEFDYKSKSINSESVTKLKGGYVYSISPGGWGRLAIAGVDRGLSLILPGNKGGKEETLAESEVYDCDWTGNTLVANGVIESVVSNFSALPKREDFQDELTYREVASAMAKIMPETVKLDPDPDGGYLLLTPEGELVDSRASGISESRVSVIKARSAPYGFVVEHEDCVLVKFGSCSERVAETAPVFWRTFGRSTNYLNHLHICDENGLQLRAYSISSTTMKASP